MRCTKVKKLLPPMMDGNLSEERAALLQAHLSGCDSCRSTYNHLLQLGELLNKPAEVQPDPYFLTRLKARIGEEKCSAGKQTVRPALSPAFLVAGLLVGAFLGITAGIAVMDNPVSPNYADYYRQADLFRTLPAGSLAAAYSQLAVNLPAAGGGHE